MKQDKKFNNQTSHFKNWEYGWKQKSFIIMVIFILTLSAGAAFAGQAPYLNQGLFNPTSCRPAPDGSPENALTTFPVGKPYGKGCHVWRRPMLKTNEIMEY